MEPKSANGWGRYMVREGFADPQLPSKRKPTVFDLCDGDPCWFPDCTGHVRVVPEDHDESHPVWYCDVCGRTLGDEEVT